RTIGVRIDPTENMIMVRRSRSEPRGLALAATALLAVASIAHAEPIELKDQNGTKYDINTNVDPLVGNSEASGAIANATYVQPVSVTSYFAGLTSLGFLLASYTVQRQVNVPLTNAFAGFNGLTITAAHGVALPKALVFNPGQGLASQDCSENGQNRELVFQSQSFPRANLEVSRKVFVPADSDFVRWLDIVTNTGSTPQQVGVTLQGLLGSGGHTKIDATSSGDETPTAADLWFTSGQSVPQGELSTEPTVGFVIQGDGATVPALSVGVNSSGQAIVTYSPMIPAGGSVIFLTLSTVQGNFKQAKKTVENL